LLKKLIDIGVVSNRQDYVRQLEAIMNEVETLRQNQENVRPDKVQVEVSILVDGNEIVQMIEHLLRNENGNENDALVCSISFDRMQDPVLVIPSGHTYDKKFLCDWLLLHPNQDPMTPGEQCDPALMFADNIALRKVQIQQHGDGAYVKYDNTSFQKDYLDVQFNLGENYLNGLDVTQNDATAVQWFRRAADKGHAEAQCNLGFMYCNGRGVTQNHGTAVELFRYSAEQGNDMGQYNLGIMYTNGTGVNKDDAQAFQLYHLATKQGLAGAQYMLGCMYKEGDGVAKSCEAAASWYRLAADQGHAKGKAALDALQKNNDA
jgi:Sel1 repeat/U-box domain